MKAFRVICKAFDPEITSITWAETPAQAKYINWQSANEMGYGIKFGDLKVKRAAEYDDHPKAELRECKGEEYLTSDV